MKVCILYTVINQAAALFLHHIDNFVTDGLPEKLMVFLEYIQNATVVCITRNIFDADDVVSKVMKSNKLIVFTSIKSISFVSIGSHWKGSRDNCPFKE